MCACECERECVRACVYVCESEGGGGGGGGLWLTLGVKKSCSNRSTSFLERLLLLASRRARFTSLSSGWPEVMR